MALNWENYVELADALNEAYPEQPLLDLSDEELIKLVTALPDFADTSVPKDERAIPAVWNRWVAVAYPEDNDDAVASA